MNIKASYDVIVVWRGASGRNILMPLMEKNTKILLEIVVTSGQMVRGKFIKFRSAHSIMRSLITYWQQKELFHHLREMAGK